jgi:hypothetical protein
MVVVDASCCDALGPLINHAEMHGSPEIRTQDQPVKSRMLYR